jgi:hypothetical protein
MLLAKWLRLMQLAGKTPGWVLPIASLTLTVGIAR